MSYISDNFTPLASAIGGLTLGLSATIYLLFAGRITGMSGMLGGLVQLDMGSLHWKSIYVVCCHNRFVNMNRKEIERQS